MPVTIKDNTAYVILETRKEVEQFIRRKALEIVNEAKRSMVGGGKPHVPSAPGEPPHVDTGRLRSSITFEFESSRSQFEARVGTNVIYGKFLELGTVHIRPRPWLRPAFFKVIGGGV